MRKKQIEVTMAALDRNGYCTAQQLAAAGDLVLDGAFSAGYDRNGVSVAQTPAAAGDLTITGALASGGIAHLATPRRLLIYSDGNDSGVTFTVYGTDKRGDQVYEAITGPNATFVFSTNTYYTVTRVAISAAGTGSIEVGSTGIGTADYPRRVGIYCAGDINTVNFTVYGLDRNGVARSEVITGVNTDTVDGVYNFATITRITADAAVGTNVEVGTTDVVDSAWIPLPQTSDTTLSVGCGASCGFTYTVELTPDDVQASDFDEATAEIQSASADLTSIAATSSTHNANANATSSFSAVRLKLEAYTSGTGTFTVAPSRWV